MNERNREYLAQHLARRRVSFFRALAADAQVFAFHRGEINTLQTRLQRITYALTLPLRQTEFLGLALYRLRVLLKRAHIPILPSLLNYACAVFWGMQIGDFVVIQEGVFIPHGQMVLDGPTYIEKGCVLCPYISIGLVQGTIRGPVLEEGVFVGTGARILGDLRIGYAARIGANAVVLSDIPAWSTAVGAPARAISILAKEQTASAEDPGTCGQS